jgi:heptosyltransferase-2
MRIGVFVPNWVGDVVMATPTLRSLRGLAGPDGRLIGVMRPYVAEVLEGLPWFDDVVLYAKGSGGSGSGGASSWPEARRRLRRLGLDCAVLLTNSLRTAWMAWQSGARERIGLAGNLRSPLLTTRVFAPRRGWRRAPLPTIDGYLQIAQAAGGLIDSPRLELATTEADERRADAAWARLGLDRGGPVAVLNTGGAFGAAKDWPGEHFSALARRLAEAGWQVAINCGPRERESAARVAAGASHRRVTSLAEFPELPLGLTKALVRRCQLLVTTDSGPRFFGVAFGVPTVALFGPTSVAATRTGAAHEICLSLGLPCQPCMARTCPLSHHRCLRDLSVDQAWQAIERLTGSALRAA